MSARLLRGAALAIALAALIDPVATRQRPVPPVVALHVAPGADELAGAVRATLAGEYALAPAPVAGAAARVVVGAMLPAGEAAPGFVVVADGAAERPVVVALDAPQRAPLHGRVPVGALIRPHSADPEAVVELRVDGMVADRLSLGQLPREGDGLVRASLSFAPIAARPHRVAVTLAEARAETLVEVDDRPWHVLVYDPRPSWSSTFVRRALESDPRFVLAARIDTSPRSATTSGAPRGLADPAALDGLDVIVVGAPDALDDNAARTLRAFLRERGGAVVALIDDAPGVAAELSGTAGWSERLSPAPARLVAGDGEPWLQASEIALPAALPAAATLLAGIDAGAGLDPVVWQRPVGRGRLVVSGALDAWRYRAGDTRFDDFWRRVVADAAAAAAAPVALRIDRRVARPGERLAAEVTLRDAALAGGDAPQARVSARLEGASERVPLRLWPGPPGILRGAVRAPDAAGSYRLVVEAAGVEASADLVVDPDAPPPPDDAPALLEAWATAHGGAVVPASRLDELRSALAAAVTPQLVTVPSHPMRSGWWILPFALALGGEWWLRRRRGER